MRRIFGFVFLALFVIVTSAPAATVDLPGMRFPGTVDRDAQGIARISAWTRHDVFFLQGWVHAQDRLFQMDFTRKAASGTLAELVGDAGLGNDVQARAIGLRRAAEASWLAISPRAREAIAAYAAGVNAGIGSVTALPPEYGALELTRVDPWTPIDTVVIAKAIAFSLSFDLDDIDRTIALLTYMAAGNVLGFDGTRLFFEDLFTSRPFNPASTVPDASGAGAKPGLIEIPSPLVDVERRFSQMSPAVLPLLLEYRESVSKTALFGNLGIEEMRAGSNEWAIAGRHTSSGRSLMANDPHLALSTPSTFYPIALRAPNLNVIGMGFPGTPFVILGQNERIAWGATRNPMDVTDVYVEQLVLDPTAPAGLSTRSNGETDWLLPILQTFRKNNPGDGTMDNIVVVPPGGPIPQAALIVPRKNAPIIALDVAAGTAISVQYTGLWGTREIESFLVWNEARNLEDFQRGLEMFDFGSQNWSYVDVDGNIAYFTSGEMPLREDLQDNRVEGAPPYLIRDGSGGNDWIRLTNPPAGQAIPYEILPANEMPHLINPPAGWFVNANNDPAGTTLDGNPLNQVRPGGGIFYLSPGYDGYRAGRITQMIRDRLAGGGKISFADMQAMQADTVMIDAEFFMPIILGAHANAGGAGAHPALAALGSSPAVSAAVARLAAWDLSTPTGIPEGYDASDVGGVRADPSQAEIATSVAATIYSVWRGQILRNTVDGVMDAGGLPKPDGEVALAALKQLFEFFPLRGGMGASGINFFNVPDVQDPAARRDIIVLKSLADSLALLASPEFAPAFGGSTDLDDYRWGKLHRIVFAHSIIPQFSIPSAAIGWPAPLAGLPGIPTDGGFGVVDASSHSPRAAGLNSFMFGSGPVRRFVAEGGSGTLRTHTSLPGGTSGIPGSPFYFNLLPMWLTNESFEQQLQSGPTLPWGAR